MAADGTRNSRGSTPQIGPIMGIVSGFCIVLALCWLQIGNGGAGFVIPSPTMPNINACDFFLRAGVALQNAKAIDAAATAYPNKGSATVGKSGVSFPPGTVLTLAAKAKLVQANSGPLDTVRKGLAYPCLEPPVRSLETSLSYYLKYRTLARLLRLDAQVRAARGDWNGATASDLDAVEMGEAIPHGAGIIGTQVGVSCQTIGRSDIWKALDHLNAAQARSAVARMERIQANHFDFAETLQEQKWTVLSDLQEFFRTGDLSGSGKNARSTGPFSEQNLTKVGLNTVLSLIGKRNILQNYAHYVDQVRANTRFPYVAHVPSPLKPWDPISKVATYGFEEARLKDLVSETQNRLLVTALALRAYRAEHNAYPQTLEELVSRGYLKAVPADLFAMQGPLRYSRTGTTYRLYSIGPDGSDDGGKPIHDPSAAVTSSNPNAPYLVKKNSRGDIVAGKNIW